MRGTTIAHRYAQALLDIGIERENFEQLGRELIRVKALFASPDLKELFRNPKFGVPLRRKVMAELLKEVVVSSIVQNFLFLLIDRNRIRYLPQICESFEALMDGELKRLKAKITVAQSLSSSEAAKLRASFKKMMGREIILEQDLDPSIIGGVITRIDGRIYDGSIRAQLESLRAQLKRVRS